MIADTVFSIVVEIIFLVQGKVFSMVPIKIIGAALNLLHNCLLHSLYSFEYKWFSQGLELHKRLDYVETNWPYFLGFGLPLAVITSMPDSQVGKQRHALQLLRYSTIVDGYFKAQPQLQLLLLCYQTGVLS